jgi:hypothetical protein
MTFDFKTSAIELQEACRYVPGAVLLLVRRMAKTKKAVTG